MISPVILAIESSCDETSAAVFKDNKICANIIATQEVHAKYGGVVPEMASRAHEKHIIPVVQEALLAASTTKNELDAIAFTKGPGLLGALLVGNTFAKSLALSLNKPLIGVNHMQAHILAHFIGDKTPRFPFLCLTVSGGHTQIVLVKNYLDMEIIGETQDDAAGEAFDKTAKLLDLPYPGGPLIDQYAAKGNAHAFDFPLTQMPEYNFSFSGIKTAILYFLRGRLKQDKDFIQKNLNDICASVQYTLIETLSQKLVKAAKDYNIHEIAIAGGVAANKGLRNKIAVLSRQHNWNTYIPDFKYCTDNAAMIAQMAFYLFQNNYYENQSTEPDPRMAFINLRA